ncbi:MAG TPA: chromosomal replication initiator protein DnaA [Clostridia bacterium]|nr:chromosomal replication initiator protein DnaA [Clostridia bacterium]
MNTNLAEIQETWKKALPIISKSVSQIFYDVFIANLEPISISDNKFILIAPYESCKNSINKSYKSLIEKAVMQFNPYIDGINIITPDDVDSFIDAPKSIITEQKTDIEEENSNNKDYYTSFEESYSFDNFVTGGSNKAAFVAAKTVAENPGVQHNPLFIYGGVGLGKTHIMHAIGNYIKSHSPKKKIIYMTSENFTNDYIDSIRNNNSKDMNRQFRNKYRNLDVLMIDDIQFISGKPSTQEALFHLFNELYQSKKQIVFTSDCHPKEIDNIDERLTSRFQSGLTVDISNPDLETRIAILRKKAYNKKFEVSNNVINYIAECINTNIRELEGALSKVIFYCTLNNIKADNLDIVNNALKDDIDNISGPVTMNTILKCVADYFHLDQKDLIGKKKTKNIVEARQIAIYLISDLISVPLVSIGDFMGGRDHSTIIHARDKIISLLSSDYKYANYIRDLYEIINKK